MIKSSRVVTAVGHVSSVLLGLFLLSAGTLGGQAQVTSPSGYSFGTVNLGSSASTTVTFSFTSSVSVGSVSVVTQGATGKDFQPTPADTSTTLCTAKTYTSGQSCTVDVTFAPLSPGKRLGAAILRNGTNQVIGTAYVAGTGSAAQLGFSAPTVSTFVGKGVPVTTSPSGLSGTSAGFLTPFQITFDAAGNMYMADDLAETIYKITPAGLVSSVIGQYRTGCGSNYTCGYPTSNSTTLAASSSIYLPYSIFVDGAGLLWFVDNSVAGVATVDLATGYVTAQIPGNGNSAGAPHISGNIHALGISSLGSLSNIATDGLGNVYVACFLDAAQASTYSMIAKVDPAGNISIIAGNTTPYYGHNAPADGTVATTAVIGAPTSMAFDSAGNLYYYDAAYYQVFKIDTAGKVHLFAGSGSIATDNTSGLPYWQSGTASTTANTAVNFAKTVGYIAVDASGNVYVPSSPSSPSGPFDTTSLAPRVFVFTPSGYAYVLAGNGTIGEGNGAATASQLSAPDSVAVNGTGDVYVSENYIRQSQASPAVYIGSSVRKWSMAASTVTFGSQAKGSTSAGQTVTATNLGNAPLVLTTPTTGTNPSASNGFTLLANSATNSCGTGSSGTVAVNSSCSVVPAFEPNVASGSATGALTFAGNVAAATIPLSGTATTGVASLSMTGLPASTSSGGSNTVTVSAYDDTPSLFAGYSGTVHFSVSPSDVAAALPSDYTFTGTEGGTKTFPVALSAAGAHIVAVTDVANTLTGSENTTVAGPAGPASGTFGGNYTPTFTPAQTYASIFNAQLNAYDNILLGDVVDSTDVDFRVHYLSGAGYANVLPARLTLYAYNYDGGGIDSAGNINYCYYNRGSVRINTRIPNGSVGTYTPTYNIFTTASSDAARCITGTDGTVYLAPGDGTLQTAFPATSGTFTVATVTGTPAGVVQAVLGYNGSLILSATGGTYVGTIDAGAWTGTLATTRTFYNYAAYQDATGKIYLEDSATQAGYQYTLGSSSYAESSWTKPFGVTAVSYSLNNGGSLLVASPTALQLLYSSSLTFPSILVGTADPIEELVFQITAGGTLASTTITSSGGTADFIDAGTGSCTTNGPTHTYAVGDLCTVDVKFTPTAVGSRTGTVTVNSTNTTVAATAALRGVGLGRFDHLAFTTVPASATSGTAFSVTVKAYVDAAGTTVATTLPSTALTITSSDTAATLPTNLTLTNGVATFNVTLNSTGNQTITASDTADAPVITSGSIAVAAGIDHILVTGLPTAATAGTAVSGTVTAYSNSGTTVATNYTGPVTISSSDTNGILPSPLTLSNGTANFSVTLKTTPSQTITATTSGATPVVNTLTVSAAAAATVLASTGGGQSAIIGNAFTSPLVVQTVDAYSNPVGGVTVSFAGPATGQGATFSTSSCVTSATATPAGSCSVTATANATVGSYSVTASSSGLTAGTFTLTNNAKTAQTITFAQPGAQTFGTTPTLTASTPSGLTLVFSSSTAGVCSISTSGLLAFSSAGTCTINVDQAGNATYAAGTTVSRSFAVNAVVPGAPTIGTAVAANSQATVSFTAPAFTGGAAISGYTVTSSPGGKTVTGTASPITVTGLTNGTAYTFTVTATNSAGPGSASSASNSVTPSGVQTITFGNPGTQTYGATPTLTATANSGLTVSFTSTTTGVCIVSSGGLLSFVATGICSINADQAGNGIYNAATTVTQSFNVQAASQTITFAQPTTPVTYGVSPLALSATGGASGNAVTFSVLSGPGTVSGSTLTATGAGTIVVAADQAGNTSYSAAIEVLRSIVVNPASQTILFTQPTTPITYGSTTTVSLSAAGGTSGNAVTFTVASGPGSINGSTLTITGAGTVVVNANQEANASYAAALQVQRSLVVSTAASTLTAPTTQPVFVVFGQSGAVPVSIAGQYSGSSITAPSGAITYSIVNASNATVASGPLTIAAGAVSVPVASTLAPGLYTINAAYAGDTNYSAATPVTINLQVGQIQPLATITAPASVLTYGSSLGISASAAYNNASVAGSFSYTATPAGGIASAVTAATILPAGSYVLTANITPTDTVTYKTATTSEPLTVAKATPGVTLTSSVNPILVQNAIVLTATVNSAVSTLGGTVTFYDNTAAAAIGAAVPLTGGIATLSVSTLTVGTHSIIAIYSGDTNFVTVTSAAVSEQVIDFSLAISTSAGSATSQTVVPGGTATYSFTLSPTGTTTFPAAVNLTVTGLPTGATYTITPATLAAGSASTAVTLTVTAPKQTAMLHTGEKLAPFALALLLLPLGSRIRRRAGKLSRLVALSLLLVGGVGSIATLTGCGSTTGFFASPQQTYNVTITGTSGALTHSTTVTLTVQ